ncbi:putative profilin [Helianthus annuus]|nr:putative profilin [Helianthus annuus]KAJ0891157.1 putative profilin [Helianthus annuus]
MVLQLKLGEIPDIMKAFDVVGSLASTRLHLGGSKYKVTKGEAGTVFRGKEVISLPYFLSI